MFHQTNKLKNNKNKNEKPRVALDIDETLSWTNYWVMSQMLELFGNPEDLTTTEVISKYRYTYNVPYWQTDEIKLWLHEKFTSNQVQKELPLLDNANHYVNQLSKKVEVVAYITARPEEVIPGTEIWLKKHDFPEAPVIARPRYVAPEFGNSWKADLLYYLYPQVEAIIDDNPKLVLEMKPDYKGTIFLYSHDSSPLDDDIATDSDKNKASQFKVIPVNTWEELVEGGYFPEIK